MQVQSFSQPVLEFFLVYVYLSQYYPELIWQLIFLRPFLEFVLFWKPFSDIVLLAGFIHLFIGHFILLLTNKFFNKFRFFVSFSSDNKIRSFYSDEYIATANVPAISTTLQISTASVVAISMTLQISTASVVAISMTLQISTTSVVEISRTS